MSDIDDVFAMLGFGRMQYFVLSACLLVQLWLTNEQLGFAVVVAGANCELELDDERISWLMATNFAAQMLTCLMWGELADRFGRRRIIMCAGLTSIMLSILSACMPEYWSFLVVRSLAGFFAFALPIWMVRIRILTSEVEERLSVCEHLDGYSPKRNPPKCRLSYEDMKDQLIQGFVVLGLFVVTSLLLICINRKVVILFYIGAATGGCLLLNFVTHPYVILASFLIVMDPPLCSIRLIATILIDLVPTRLRGKALALTSILSRCGVLVISLYMGYTLSRFCYVTFNLFILLFLVCGVLVHLLPSETKMKSLTQ
ncbi:uncharacterized protein LOC108099315 isoform X3 [Drosophila ficusphila]|uniref:uncharacterized protein LOC108099315 isoform X3 n=1 Tax=Drosophila ficusphila TaxID=30025 RepID=UPI001C8A74DD|nr:uncharacterized protein LOC108099315 isoform X3 [Drosophila ficusphila]